MKQNTVRFATRARSATGEKETKGRSKMIFKNEVKFLYAAAA